MGVQSLGGEDPLEGEMATHSSILPWKILWTEESGGLKSMGSKRVRHDLQQLYSLDIRRSESFNFTFQGCLGHTMSLNFHVNFAVS